MSKKRENNTLNVECLLWLARNPLLDFVELKAILIAKIVNLFVDLFDGDFHLVRDRLNRRDSLIAIFVFAEILVPQALVDFVESDEILRLLTRPIVLRHRSTFTSPTRCTCVTSLREQKCMKHKSIIAKSRENENKRKNKRGLSDHDSFCLTAESILLVLEIFFLFSNVCHRKYQHRASGERVSLSLLNVSTPKNKPGGMLFSPALSRLEW
jgi:hypothetical protein